MNNGENMTLYDELTGLPNMNMFHHETRKLMERTTMKDKFAIAYIDIDNFRYINQTIGHEQGNVFLQHVASNLKSAIKTPYVIARISGDEFAVLFTKVKSQKDLFAEMKRILKKLCNTWTYNDFDFYVSMSTGIAIYPDHGKDVKTLYKNVDIAMHTAKQESKDIVFFEEKLSEDILWQVQMTNEIQTSIEKEEFTLYYQPQFKLNTNKIIGAEALVRWVHPEKGIISPSDFIPVAEKSKQIFALEQWIINKALSQKVVWEKEGYHDMELSINLSSKTLESDYNFKKILKIFSSYKIDYSKIVIEVTETALIYSPDMAAKRLNQLKKYGMKIALDDFGTGYSSLNHLKQLPIDIIKLDRSFVDMIPGSGTDTLIVKYILSLARELNYRVIAEGIETREQLNCLKNYTCERGQGFLLSLPLPKVKMNELLKKCFS